ncbi:1,2-phenylacetyl-CoA epoxidase subunit PaaC [Longimicrobium sp.]|uniref:1,2-phenylacetyl-CoA epoxidase subunit PaaC n=1 Tax=Longimicrobium sp. TaxID=2029185 RepID=UPI002B9499D1|nr:Phenylacetic acid catabolic protein [Longimicrobium sp.]HSU14875.1 Phenylacetic acid catabolic protein [Longimicrobium sp.]
MTDTLATAAAYEKADQLPDDVRAPLRELILALADSKRVLGLRYSDRMLGSPTLEAGIAASSMAQDEWGHARLTYALLGDFGDDPKALEHERDAAEYRSMNALDAELDGWHGMTAAGLLLDMALTAQYAALAESRYTPLRNRVQKLLDEEKFHFQYAASWARRIAQVPELRAGLAAALERALPQALQWLGRDEAPGARRMVDEGVVRDLPSDRRARFLARVAPVLEEIGLADPLGVSRDAGEWTYTGRLDWAGWDDATRRAGGSLDEVTAARARGDKNRALLMD